MAPSDASVGALNGATGTLKAEPEGAAPSAMGLMGTHTDTGVESRSWLHRLNRASEWRHLSELSSGNSSYQVIDHQNDNRADNGDEHAPEIETGDPGATKMFE